MANTAPRFQVAGYMQLADGLRCSLFFACMKEARGHPNSNQRKSLVPRWGALWRIRGLLTPFSTTFFRLETNKLIIKTCDG